MTRPIALALLFLVAAFVCCEAQGPLCPLNSADNICGRFCEPTCANPWPVCAQRVCDEDTRGCRCNAGYLRDTRTGFCVSSNQCT
ncbi:hypothetical protein PV327_009208 [Microctonus hyperodae]|uniref:TIL domain-containing protein n=1 Tax=Microctonus hyperodae TaxID=165561 RepID=A0AA39FTZ8_MICHY|nr:hypothetical protein PV327_009208 [Microctonus hyperodae]